jgi:surfeit locus 1 family protein
MNPLARPVLSLAVLSAFLFLIGLGTWQVHRLQWKQDLIADVAAQLAQPPVEIGAGTALAPYRPVALPSWRSGDRFAHVVGTYEGRSGYYVFGRVEAPTGVFIVNHGFVPREARATDYDLPADGPLIGLARENEPLSGFMAWVTPDADPGAGTFYGRELGPIAAYLGLPSAPAYYIDRTDNAAGVPQGDTTRLEFSNRHLGYAITWYGLAAGLLAVYVLMMRSNTRS